MATADGLVQDAGWPFLVAAGRIRDYTVLVAPDFLVAAGEHGLLGVTGSAIEGGPVQVRPVRTNDGRELTLAYAARLLSAADMPPGAGEQAVADEFGRPLRIVVGVVTERPRGSNPAPDVERAEAVVLPAYRRFREDEARYRVQASQSMPMRSRGQVQAAKAVSPNPELPPVDAQRSTVAPRRSGTTVGAPGLVVGLILAALLAVGIVLLWPRSSSNECPAAPTTTTTSATVPNGAQAGQPLTDDCP